VESDKSIDIETLRRDVLLKVLQLCVVFGSILYVWALIQELRDRDFTLAVFHSSLFSLFLFVAITERISHIVRTSILVFVLLGFAFVEFLFFGTKGEGAIFVLLSLALVTLMIGKRAGYISVAVTVSILFLIAQLRISGWIDHWNLRNHEGENFDAWVATLLEIALFCTGLNYLIASLFEKLMAGLDDKESSESRYRLLAENSEDVIWAVDMNYEYIYLSPSIKKMIDRTPEEVMSMKFTAIGTEHFEIEVQDHIKKLLVADGDDLQDHRLETDIRHHDGHMVPTETVLSLLRDESNQPYGILGVTRNISTRKEADKERESLEFQLRQSQKMESIGQLAGGVAHDFNNLLQAILGFSELAKKKVDSGTPLDSFIGQTMEAGERARELVAQLLAFSRQQVLELSDIDLNAVIEDLIKMIERVIGEHIVLDFSSTSDLGTIRADRGQIEQILMNLCVNARDAMGEGGTLVIETTKTTLDEEFSETNSWAIPGEYVVLSVTDTGVGMTDQVQERIFEPFFTTKELGGGTGLGLSTVFGIVRQHDGMINVYSEPDFGTTFRVYLPVVEASDRVLPKPTRKNVEGGTETILLADDDEMVRKVTIAMLSEMGYTVIAAENGEEAIQLFDTHVDEIELALLDVVMPKQGGKAVMEHIQSKYPAFPILFSSGYSNDAIHTNFVLDDDKQLIQKPYHREDLMRKVREVISNSQVE